jgi:hypothetical protein
MLKTLYLEIANRLFFTDRISNCKSVNDWKTRIPDMVTEQLCHIRNGINNHFDFNDTVEHKEFFQSYFKEMQKQIKELIE